MSSIKWLREKHPVVLDWVKTHHKGFVSNKQVTVNYFLGGVPCNKKFELERKYDLPRYTRTPSFFFHTRHIPLTSLDIVSKKYHICSDRLKDFNYTLEVVSEPVWSILDAVLNEPKRFKLSKRRVDSGLVYNDTLSSVFYELIDKKLNKLFIFQKRVNSIDYESNINWMNHEESRLCYEIVNTLYKRRCDKVQDYLHIRTQRAYNKKLERQKQERKQFMKLYCEEV